MNTKNIPSKEETLQRFTERFPVAMKQSYPGHKEYKEYTHLYQVSPPADSVIANWTNLCPRTVLWAGMNIDIPDTFWDDDLLINLGN